ncbi:Os02g0479801 [Oryza sativa Japonica Group]|uniref:Os02g0479801 protein n=1 Tax=Oryza sativa subsp. japonica TaxID=39947 RepID=A0A0P0VJ17_ORYSJ|nr:Os02g0479801 [Oryza sativa Japonica Group]
MAAAVATTGLAAEPATTGLAAAAASSTTVVAEESADVAESARADLTAMHPSCGGRVVWFRWILRRQRRLFTSLGIRRVVRRRYDEQIKLNITTTLSKEIGHQLILYRA